MPDCSKTEVFFKELKRMCNKFNSTCVGCKIYDICFDIGCYSFIKNDPQKAIEIVQKWSDEHPIKTRQSEFLKVFPNAHLINGVINICPKTAFFDFGDCPTQKTCDNCRKEYWLAEVE